MLNIQFPAPIGRQDSKISVEKVLNKSAFFISCAGVATPYPIVCAASGGGSLRVLEAAKLLCNPLFSRHGNVVIIFQISQA